MQTTTLASEGPSLLSGLVKQNVDQFFEKYDAYIKAQAQHRFNKKNSMAKSETYDLDVDDLTQTLRLNCWLALRQRPIENPRAYISRAAHNETVTLARQYKPCQSLPLDDDGEFFQGRVNKTFNTQAPDPAEIVERNEDECCLLEAAIEAILKLPQTQRYAMLSSMKERVENPQDLHRLCRRHNIDLDAIQWPEKPTEVQRMRASLSVARKNKDMQNLRSFLVRSLKNSTN
ncbi:RNA polymerase sigma factor [Ktedonospora formicarum]|uniref:Uncharacterized protein n=1 Tax=Ktedonospora formicarum TaxID=2778364 RepID=A0A8J3I1G5_9CHLR|nr:hypothetical protein [Ktedonospora formicarum]GHO44328.1 hypothetical protein KSX_24910 [Ktedonospora formicarum]